MSTQSAQARLKDGLRELQQAWRQANEQWNDQAAAEFHKDIVEPLEPRVSSALTAMGELGTALGAARREVE